MATRALQVLLGDEVKTSAVGSAGNRRGPVKGFLASVQRAAGALEFVSAPAWR